MAATTAVTVATLTPPALSLIPAARVLFRQPVANDGFLDAGWWPRSRDLATELPALLDTLWLAGRDVMRISYALSFWEHAPRRLRVADRVVRLGGFNTQTPGLLTLIDAWGRDRVNVLVIPPDTDPAIADRALTLVAGQPSPDRPEQVLERARDQVAIGLNDDRRRSGSDAWTQAWEDDGALPHNFKRQHL
jgi:hypothetical protein